MKKLFLIGIPLFSALSFAMDINVNDLIVNKYNINNKINLNDSFLKRVRVNLTVFGHHVTGWVDITQSPSGTIHVGHYDIYVEDPFGNVTHNVGKITRNENGETIIEVIVTDEKGNAVEMSEDMIKVLTETNNQVIKENF